ncbi:MAG TPA: hypothetical protein VNF27_10150 [Candidatus Binataceae bacterium]|nr:hypothetical protein [Candidatus Binataceae bacterium]
MAEKINALKMLAKVASYDDFSVSHFEPLLRAVGGRPAAKKRPAKRSRRRCGRPQRGHDSTGPHSVKASRLSVDRGGQHGFGDFGLAASIDALLLRLVVEIGLLVVLAALAAEEVNIFCLYIHVSLPALYDYF